MPAFTKNDIRKALALEIEINKQVSESISVSEFSYSREDLDRSMVNSNIRIAMLSNILKQAQDDEVHCEIY